MNLMYLLTAFVSCGVTGHIRVANLSLQDKFSNPIFSSDIFPRKASLVFLKVSQPNKKCCSVSKYCLLVVVFVCVLFRVAKLFVGLVWQKIQKRSVYGVTGRVRRRTSC